MRAWLAGPMPPRKWRQLNEIERKPLGSGYQGKMKRVTHHYSVF